VHEKFHGTGSAVIEAVRREKASEAHSLLNQAQGQSQQIFALIDSAISDVKKSDLGIEVMRVSTE